MPRYVDMSGWDSFMNEMLDSRNMYDHYDHGYTDAMDRVDYWIEAQPTIDPESLRPHGRWIKKWQDIYCSECDSKSKYTWYGGSAFSKYCPNCGAKMGLEEEK